MRGQEGLVVLGALTTQQELELRILSIFTSELRVLQNDKEGMDREVFTDSSCSLIVCPEIPRLQYRLYVFWAQTPCHTKNGSSCSLAVLLGWHPSHMSTSRPITYCDLSE